MVVIQKWSETRMWKESGNHMVQIFHKTLAFSKFITSMWSIKSHAVRIGWNMWLALSSFTQLNHLACLTFSHTHVLFLRTTPFSVVAGENNGGLGCCGWIIVIISAFFSILIFPISLFISIKVWTTIGQTKHIILKNIIGSQPVLI